MPEVQITDTWQTVHDFLTRRRGLLDAVVFSGGEPTTQKALFDAVSDVRALGFEVGLHTAGPYPHRLRRLLPLLDWVGMDVKAPLERYEAVTGVPGSGDRAFRSVRSILDHGIAYEIRTTFDPTLLSRDDIVRLARSLADLGVRNFALQHARDENRRPIAGWLDDSTIACIESRFTNFVLRD
jgi:pyruvate formate lyase activating enzyme